MARADEVLWQVRSVLNSPPVLEDGLDGPAIRYLVNLIERGMPKRGGGSSAAPQGVPASGRTMTRAECAEPGCRWENSHLCPHGDHATKVRRYMLIDDDAAGDDAGEE